MRSVSMMLGGIWLAIAACGDVSEQQAPPDAPVVDAPPPRCTTSADCDDGLFCNGAETCDESDANANALGCVAGTPPACALDELCTETGGGSCAPRCDVDPDLDGDGFESIYCGGTDCNDDRATINPDAYEVCDAHDVDEDCSRSTYVTVGHADNCTACGVACAAQQACENMACIAARRVFISSTAHTGKLGGVAGADVICQNLATAASLGGTWKALITTTGLDVVTRLGNGASVPYVRLDGVRIANSFADLVDGTLIAPLNISERRGPVNTNVWTGMNASTVGQNDCGGWTDETTGCLANGPCGQAGQSYEINANWDGAFVYHCNSAYHLYCLEQ